MTTRYFVPSTAAYVGKDVVFVGGGDSALDWCVMLGSGEVATAVNNVAVHIDPDAQLVPGHSTDVPHAVPVHA